MGLRKRNVVEPGHREAVVVSPLYAGLGPVPSRAAQLGGSVRAGERVVRDFAVWDAEFGLDYRAQRGWAHNADRTRILAGETPDLDRECPPPPGWERFDRYPRAI